MRTLLALVAATAMIAAALYVRAGGSDGEGRSIIPDGDREPAVLVCIPELESVCREVAGDGVEVTIEEAGVTADRLAAGDQPSSDAWLTLAPWPEIASEARQRAGASALPAAGEPQARSPLVMVVSGERAQVLDQHCGATLSWRCIGRVAGQPWARIGGQEGWGEVKPGFTDPAVSASGLLVVAQAAGDFLQTGSFSAREMSSDAFLAWSSQLERSVPTHGTSNNPPLQRRVQFGAASFDVVGATEAEAGPLLATSARATGLELRYPETPVVAEVVLAPLRESEGAEHLGDVLADSGGSALAAAGWRVEGEPTVAGVPQDLQLPPESNLPSAGVLDALRARWGEIQR